MQNSKKAWLLASAAISILVGYLLVLKNSAAGWFLIIMGIAYLAAATRAGEKLTASNPRLVKWGLIGMTLLLLLFAFVAGVLFWVY
jgi:uncharacterized membrane protein HdeD (DUF308 family)